MRYGLANSTVQASFAGTYKAFDSGAVEVTATADVRFWLDTYWSGDDFGGDASSIASSWAGGENGNNIKTDDTVDYIEVKKGTDSWERVYVS